MPISKQNEEDIKAQIELYSKHLTSKATNLNYTHLEDFIIEKYKYIRDHTTDFMKKDKNGTVVIDRHKIAAGIIVSILKIKPISIINKNNATKKDFSANYYLGYLSALGIIMDFFKTETNIKLEITNYTMEYMNHFRDLMVANKDVIRRIADRNHKEEQPESQTIFFISHIMYHLEKHLIEAYENKILKKRLEKYN
jgi:hypothetical protein